MKHILLALCLGVSPAAAQDYDASADNHLAACKDIAENPDNQTTPAHKRTFCYATYLAILHFELGRKVCPPPDQNSSQHLRVLVQNMERRPRDLHYLLVRLMEEAFREEYPCRTR